MQSDFEGKKMVEGSSTSKPMSSLGSECHTSKNQHSKKPPSTQNSSVGSPVRTVDPLVRALNTIMYGLVVHFGTLQSIDGTLFSSQRNDECVGNPHSVPSASWVWCVLFFHEYWVYLQHSNVLANPLCQRLDRQYGIALLKSNQHWAIAGTLSAYWCRESLGMFLCLPFLAQENLGHSNGFSWTIYGVLYSLVYHTIKSRGVRQDALRRHSPSFGIMRIVIDKFYLHSIPETLLSLSRLLLQGLDTFIHFQIIRDMYLQQLSTGGPFASALRMKLHALFTIWVLHAALNQYFRCSTASIMVQTWKSLTASVRQRKKQPRAENDTKDNALRREDDEDTEVESLSSSDESFASSEDSTATVGAEEDQDFVVRKLLREGRVPDILHGRQGAASHGVDKAVRLETTIAILSMVFMIGLGEVPLLGLSIIDWGGLVSLNEKSFQNIPLPSLRRISTVLVPFGWWLSGILFGIWRVFLRGRLSTEALARKMNGNRRRALLNFLDLGILLVALSHGEMSVRLLWLSMTLITWKSFRQAAEVRQPRWTNKIVLAAEFAIKLGLTRSISQSRTPDLSFVSLVVTLVWASWSIGNSQPTPCEVDTSISARSTPSALDADVVFLGHPAELHDFWALWSMPYSLETRWHAPSWAPLLWPLHYLGGWYICNIRRKLFGNSNSFFLADHVEFSGSESLDGNIRVQTWVAVHFGRHFVTHPRQVQQNIEAAAKFAEKETGTQILCLGALNKAESINGGGVGVVHALERAYPGQRRRLSIVHGNHLTAAAVVETVYQCVGDAHGAQIFLTGASSKVGWAVAQALRDKYGYDILCHSTDAGRRRFFQENGFRSTSKLSDGTTYSRVWVVGKCDPMVSQMIPQRATGIVFAVPHPLQDRPDVNVIEAGTLHIDQNRLDRPRQFTNKLASHEIFACHAAGIVAGHRLRENSGLERLDETGPVDPASIDSWLNDAKSLGFKVPPVEASRATEIASNHKEATKRVVVVGAGPAGLAVAANLSRHGVKCIVLEACMDSSTFGSWTNHFKGLEVTTEAQLCALPGLPLSGTLRKELRMGDYLKASEYQEYLQLYAARFALDIRRGLKVTQVRKGKASLESPWTVICHDTTGEERVFGVSAVVVATGKHRVPRRNTSDNLVDKLEKVGIPWAHSTDLNEANEKAWSQAMKAANAGTLALVGAGNSAADLATMLLRTADKEETCIHWAARTVPPIYPRYWGVLQVDKVGKFVRRFPSTIQEGILHLLWNVIESCRKANEAFPKHLSRWSKIGGRVPIVDKYGYVSRSLESGQLVGHGPIQQFHIGENGQTLAIFDDGGKPNLKNALPIDMVILATGYETSNNLVTREDRLNGLYTCGFGNDKLLPLKSIGEEATAIAKDICASLGM